MVKGSVVLSRQTLLPSVHVELPLKGRVVSMRKVFAQNIPQPFVRVIDAKGGTIVDPLDHIRVFHGSLRHHGMNRFWKRS